MKISVIIPVYNVEQWIESALNSVLEQDYRDLECVVVDDCGADLSMDIVRRIGAEHPRREIIKVIAHTKNLGLAGARNTGLEASGGDYVFFLDSDDRFQDSTAISAMVAAAAKYSPDIVQGNYIRVDEQTGNSTVSLYYNPAYPVYRGREIADNYKRLNFTNATNKLISRKFLSDNRITFMQGLIYEDALWTLEVYECIGSVATIPEVTYCHNLRQGSIMRSPVTVQKIDSLIFIVGRMCRSEKPDANIGQQAALNAVYALKCLFTEDFGIGLRNRKMNELYDTGIRRIRFDRAALPPFSRRLSYALSMPRAAAFVYCTAICNMYAIWKLGKNGADVKGRI